MSLPAVSPIAGATQTVQLPRTSVVLVNDLFAEDGVTLLAAAGTAVLDVSYQGTDMTLYASGSSVTIPQSELQGFRDIVQDFITAQGTDGRAFFPESLGHKSLAGGAGVNLQGMGLRVRRSSSAYADFVGPSLKAILAALQVALAVVA